MATTITPDSAAPESRMPTGDVRLASIRANLMPDEVVIARRTEALRRQIMLGLVVLLGLIIAWYAVSWWQTHQSNNDLDDANRQSIALTNQQRQFGDLVTAQNEQTTIQSQLTKLMVGDVQWKPMLATLRSKAPHGIIVTGVTADITAGAAKAGGGGGSQSVSGVGVLNQSGKLQIGTLQVTGTSHDQKSIAAYVDALSKVKGLTAPYPANISTATTGATTGLLNFTVTVILTTDAFGGRYAVPQNTTSTTTGGK